MRGLDKAERHAVRRAVRSVLQVTATELTDMHPSEASTALAEMRKRGFWYDNDRYAFTWRAFGQHVPYEFRKFGRP